MPVDTKAQIGKSLFDVQWLLNKLSEKCGEYGKESKESDLKEVKVDVISEGMGYMSTVYKCSLLFEDGHCLGYCLKVPSADKIAVILNSEHLKKELIKIHDRECQFYETFAGVPQLKLPKIYSIQKVDDSSADSREAHILMEFLGEDSGTLPLDQSLTRQQLINVAEQIAHLHAYIECHPGLIDPKDYVPFGADGFGEDKDGEKKSDFDPDEMSQKIGQAIERHGDPSLVEAIKGLDPVAQDKEFYKYAQTKSHLDAGLKPVFCHGDLWGNNILFKKDPETGKFTDEISALIDWQVSSVSNRSQDLTRLLVFNTSAELRRELGVKIYETYFEKLSHELEKSGKKPDFTIDQLIEASKPAFFMQVMFSMFLAAFHFQRPEQESERKVFMERLKQSALDAAPLVKQYADKWKM